MSPPLTNKLLSVLAIGVCCLSVESFSPRYCASSSATRSVPRPSTLFLAQQQQDVDAKTKKKGGLDEKVRTKLLAETIAPWRAVRLFAYGTLGGGALIAGLITLTSTAAVLAGARTDLDLNTCLTNLAINLGGVVGFSFLAKYDLDKGKELDARVEERLEKKKGQKQLRQGMKERETALGNLKLDIQVSSDGATREASIRELQAGASQHVILAVGSKRACRDALVGANLMKMDFSFKNILVVPYETDNELQARPSGGFGERPAYETQAYVARPAGDLDGWKRFTSAEINDAILQNGDQIKDEGIVLIVANNGKIIRRGVGKIPWRQIVDELEETVKA